MKGEYLFGFVVLLVVFALAFLLLSLVVRKQAIHETRTQAVAAGVGKWSVDVNGVASFSWVINAE
jgi:hypothetical protein